MFKVWGVNTMYDFKGAVEYLVSFAGVDQKQAEQMVKNSQKKRETRFQVKGKEKTLMYLCY